MNPTNTLINRYLLKSITFIIILISVIFYAQEMKAHTIVVQTNNGVTNTQGSERDPNIKYINGIPSNKDIGGVETSVSHTGTLSFTNYQPFTVTVTYEINYQKGPNHDDYHKIGSVVIPKNKTKSVPMPVYSHRINEIYTITRKL